MKILIFLSVIRRDEYDPKKHRLVDLPETSPEELLHYYRGTAAAVYLIEHGIIKTHDVVRVRPALELAHAEVLRRMMGRSTKGPPDGYMSDLFCVEEDLRIPDLVPPEIKTAHEPASPHQHRAQQSTPSARETPMPTVMALRAKLAGRTSEYLIQMEKLQVEKIKKIWGNNIRLDPNTSEKEKNISKILFLIREEMEVRLIPQPTEAFQEEQAFRVLKGRRAQQKRKQNKINEK